MIVEKKTETRFTQYCAIAWNGLIPGFYNGSIISRS